MTGRGRGRGRPVKKEGEEEGSPVQPSPPVVVPTPLASEPVVQVKQDEVEPDPQMVAMMAAANIYPGGAPPTSRESERGRSRGRGAGRGRGRDGPSFPQGLVPQAPSPTPSDQQVLADQFADAPESPKDGSPESEINQQSPETIKAPSPVDVEVVEETPMPEGAPPPSEHEQTSSIHSTSGKTSSAPSAAIAREPEPEDKVIERRGQKGDPLDLKTNYLRLSLLDGCKGMVEYHVSMEPPQDDVRQRRKVLGTPECRSALGEIRNFDGMILFLPILLKNDVTVIRTRLEHDPETEIKVVISFVKIKSLGDPQCVVFFNILLHRIMRELRYKELRREYYDLDMAVALDQHKLVIWPGYAINSEYQEGGLMICVDTCNRVLRQDTVYEIYAGCRGDPNMKKKFEEFIVNKIVLTKYNTKCYKIDSVDWNINPQSTFEYRGKTVTYVDYLHQRYPDMAEKITDMTQPMLISKIKPRKNEKFQEGERWAGLIPQCCYLTGLTEDQRANFKVMTDLAATTRLVPQARMQNLKNFLNRLLSDKNVVKLLNDWGLRIEKEVIDVRGRRVEGPDLQFVPNSQKVLAKAPPDFTRDATRSVFEPIEVREFVIICTARDNDKAKEFLNEYKGVCGPLGIRMVQQGKIVHLKGMKPSDFTDALRTHVNPEKAHFVVVIMPMARDDVYSAIKRQCVVNAPIPSQCIVGKTLGNPKRLRSIVQKIALQINCKLGGSLWALKMPVREEIMFIGIDAAHDPLKKDPSVIVLVATMNNECTHYFTKSKSSMVHQELSDGLGALTKDALEAYRRNRGRVPDRIVVFRDGGSLGALETINMSEANEIKKAAKKFCGESLKNYTFSIVTKRIQQRFFHKVGNRLDNPPPGTVVDSIVTRRTLYDFYVVSQQVRQGTVNPTHFVLVDTDDPIRPDLIQKLAYVTCFMYFNWSGTVRVPSVVQYAHKLASLLIKHVKNPPHPSMENTLFYL